MVARIFKPARTAMQSGQARTKDWTVEFEPQTRGIEPLMGWTSTTDTQQQVRMAFATREEAVAFCERQGIPYQVFEPKEPARRRMAYSDNFSWRRVGLWTH